MNPVWPLVWIAFLPVLLLAAETNSWRIAVASAAISMLLGSLTLLYYLHLVLHAPVTAWLIPFSIASVLFAAGVLSFRSLLLRGAVFIKVGLLEMDTVIFADKAPEMRECSAALSLLRAGLRRTGRRR